MQPAPLEPILLVRAVEEAAPEALPPEAAIDAAAAAGELEDETAWLARRARHLLSHELAPFAPLAALPERALGSHAGWALGGAFVAGLATNYLGPAGRIHVLYNPIAALVAWNVGVLALAGVRGLVRAARGREPPPGGARAGAGARGAASGPLQTDATRIGLGADGSSGPAGESGERPPASTTGSGATGAAAERRAPAPSVPAAPRGGLVTRLLVRRMLPALWARVVRGTATAREEGRVLGRVAHRFGELWLAAYAGAVALAVRRTLHWAAIGLALGAVAGMFVRGLFLEYQMVWRSTFVRDPETVAAVLRAVLGPAAWLLGRPLPDAETARALMSPEGVGAAPWIELWAVTAALFVIVPRGLALLAGAARARRARRSARLDLRDPYYETRVEAARALQIERIAESIREDVARACAALADSLADFVAERLYDARIVPRIRAFAAEGGRLADLEAEIEALCRDFEPELEAQLPEAQHELERTLRAAVAERLGVELAAGAAIAADAGALARETGGAAARPLEREIERIVGAAVTTAVVAVLGTVSGGFGKSLGVAILVTVLGTSGPVAFLIGALGGLAVAGATWWAGRERVAEGVRRLPLPAWLTRVALSESRLDTLLAEGRERCREAVRARLAEALEPVTPELAARIWAQVRPLLAARARGLDTTPADGR